MLTGCHKCWHALKRRRKQSHWSFAPIKHWRWGLPVTDCHGGWNLGPTFWTQTEVAIHAMAQSKILKEEEMQECAISWKNHGYSLLGWERCYFCEYLAQGGKNELWLPCWSTKKFVTHKKRLKCWSSMTMLGCTQVCAPERPSQILNGQSCCIRPTVLTSHYQIITCLVLLKKACKDTITPVKRHCRMPCTSGCRGWKATFTRWEYMLLFRGERRLLTKMKTILKNSVAFSVVAVKFCEIFTCPTYKQNEIKHRRHYLLTAPCNIMFYYY